MSQRGSGEVAESGTNPLTEQDELELADLAGGGTGTSPTATGGPEPGQNKQGRSARTGDVGRKVSGSTTDVMCRGYAEAEKSRV